MEFRRVLFRSGSGRRVRQCWRRRYVACRCRSRQLAVTAQVVVALRVGIAERAQQIDDQRCGIRLGAQLQMQFVGMIRLGARIAIDVERSEEPTAEIKSIMRTSYAAFCLKK